MEQSFRTGKGKRRNEFAEWHMAWLADGKDIILRNLIYRKWRIFVESLWLCEKLIDRKKSRSLSWLFDCHRSRTRNIKKRLFVSWLAPKKGVIFSFIYFFKSFCICYIPHNYVIPQAMPHAIPQAHSSFYLNRLRTDILQKTVVGCPWVG